MESEFTLLSAEMDWGRGVHPFFFNGILIFLKRMGPCKFSADDVKRREREIV
jgi:hypothetical protein